MTTTSHSRRALFEEAVAAHREKFGDFVSIEQLAIVTGVQTGVVRRLAKIEFIHSSGYCDGALLFPVETVLRMLRARRLHDHLGIGWKSMDLVLDLLDKIDGLEESQRGGENS
jgi:hypothetical protein